MKNLIRILTATLLLAACVSAAAPAPPPISTTSYTQGPSPVPLCDPTTGKCQMPAAPDTSPHR